MPWNTFVRSSGTFIALPNETPELKARSGARVEQLDVLGHSETPSLPGGAASKRYTQCVLELSWPIENFGPSLPNLMSTIAGNLFELRQVSGLRLTDLRLPASFAAAYPGPAFGIEGTRKAHQHLRAGHHFVALVLAQRLRRDPVAESGLQVA